MNEVEAYDSDMRFSLLHFDSTVRAIAGSVKDVHEQFGEHLGTAWELRDEIVAGKALSDWPCLSRDERTALGSIVQSATNVTPDSPGFDNLTSLGWIAVRDAARAHLRLRTPDDTVLVENHEQ